MINERRCVSEAVIDSYVNKEENHDIIVQAPPQVIKRITNIMKDGVCMGVRKESIIDPQQVKWGYVQSETYHANPKAYKKISLNTIITEVEKEAQQLDETQRSKICKILNLMAQHKEQKAYGWKNFCGTNFLFLRQIFSALANLLSGHGLQTSASRARALAARLSLPPKAAP